VGEWGSDLMARWRRRTGAGRPGRRDGGAGGQCGQEKGGGGRLGTHLTCGPHLSVAAWERGREAGAGGPAG
jgi:hypothetical protein